MRFFTHTSRVYLGRLFKVRQNVRELLPRLGRLDLDCQLASSVQVTTHIGTGDTGESHASLDLVQLLALGDDVMDVLQESSGDSTGVGSVGVQGLDDLLNGNGGVASPPGVKVGRGADKGVA